jgi:hypothetical protein
LGDIDLNGFGAEAGVRDRRYSFTLGHNITCRVDNQVRNHDTSGTFFGEK